MSKVIMGVLLKDRQGTAKEFQEILTRHGCIIQTRLGVHTASEDACSPQGLIILDFVDNCEKELQEFEAEAAQLHGIVIKKMEF